MISVQLFVVILWQITPRNQKLKHGRFNFTSFSKVWLLVHQQTEVKMRENSKKTYYYYYYYCYYYYFRNCQE